MAVKIRLARHGAKKRPYYRIVVAQSEAPRDGRFLEIVGTYNPLTEPATISVEAERVKHWIDHGALPSATVASLLKKAGVSTEAKAG
ncbi:30S ribosomal protein S16 [bacterium]|nr:MAG: 30S ribosomal protein S16 [bacterium]